MGKYTQAAVQLRQTMDVAGAMLTDEQALTVVSLYPVWSGDNIVYKVGQRVQYEEKLYKCLQEHSSQSVWTPVDAPSLWALVLIVDPNIISDWVQPDSTNPYMKYDKVSHNGKIWISDIDNNMWEPGVYGWSEVHE